MKHHNSTLLTTTTILLFIAANALAAEQKGKSGVPKLIIGITIDQLRTDYLYALESRLSEGGLKTLLDKGVVY